MIISYWVLPLPHLVLVVISSSLALAAYLGYSRRHHVAMHVFVHVASNVGVVSYTAGLAARRHADSIS
jgi:hypothetical protein